MGNMSTLTTITNHFDLLVASSMNPTVALNGLVWWLLPSYQDSAFLKQCPSANLNPFISPDKAPEITRHLLGIRHLIHREAYVKPLLRYAFEHGYISEVAQCQSVLRSIGCETFCIN